MEVDHIPLDLDEDDLELEERYENIGNWDNKLERVEIQKSKFSKLKEKAVHNLQKFSLFSNNKK